MKNVQRKLKDDVSTPTRAKCGGLFMIARAVYEDRKL